MLKIDVSNVGILNMLNSWYLMRIMLMEIKTEIYYSNTIGTSGLMVKLNVVHKGLCLAPVI